MFNYIMVGTNDIGRAKRFYDAVLGVLGAAPVEPALSGTGKARLFYRHDGRTFAVSEPLDGAPACHANGGTIGFSCSSPEQVLEFHAAGLAHGGTAIEDPPGPRQIGDMTMHLGYLRDPDGNKICAMFRA